jgi:predicted lipoprotein with Yx(FWY)xxD motif
MPRLVAVVLLVLAAGACAKSTTSTTSGSPAATASAAPSAATAAGGAVHTATTANFGTILVDSSGRSLYYFDKDTKSAIACTGQCATKWPPLVISSSASPGSMTGLATTKRPDGSTQVTYKDHPLYLYSGDSKAGDVNGDGFAGLWHVAKVT